ncbi:hypothetical protein CDL15_Pgr005870 [Punica granatum]|uniref:GTD-binding domain-containing protein n=1 Tax=Punica granatum TaxID=22663 RepID=A0A218WI46_PUNGR|nr:hypothetical protein CDL15_Pgr005870 [Punica granatum]
MLLLLLFVNALLSYLTTKFARYCGLQTPCLLCSRLDHVLGKERLGFYWDMICRHHKSEISSLVLCHAHCKLVDVHGICENCLFSFATVNKSNAETYRLLVGKLGAESDSGTSEEDVFLSEGRRTRKSSAKLCSCCGMLWISRGPTQTLIQTTSIMSQLVELDVPLSGVIGALKNIGDGPSKRINREISDLSHVGYTELKSSSDTESEVPFSDDDEINALKRVGRRDNSGVKPHKEDPFINIPSDDSLPANLEEPASIERTSVLLPKTKVDADEGQKDEPAGLTVGHGSEEIKWQNSEVKEKEASSSVAELISFDDLPLGLGNRTTFEELSSETPVEETNEAPVKDSEETLKVETEPITTTEKPVEANLVSSDLSPLVPNLLDLGDAYKLAVCNRGRQLSGVLTEQWLAKDSSSRVSEDLKILFSQFSAPRGLDQSSAHDLSPKVSLNNEDSLKTLDALQKRISLERNESGLSQDGSMVSEIEGESTLDRLKRQVEHDRKALNALYKELEEERSASAIAANQAMAMITRLQEEKATLQMEALQYLRMMEEQAEYDMEALQKSNDLLAEREKDIQDLEEELEFYRINFGDGNDILENLNVHPKAESIGRLKESAIGIEDERLHILESLKKLEKKLGHSSGEEVSSGSVHCESRCSGKEESGACYSTQRDNSLPNDGGSGTQEEQGTSPDNDANDDNCVGKGSSFTSEGMDLTSIWNGVSYLQKRLEALEADTNFLERTVKHLRIGEEGLQFVRDIASRLQEIRSAEPKADHQASY